MHEITTFLMFEGRAEEAMRFYVELFPGSEVKSIVRYGAAGPGPEGTVQIAHFTVSGQHLMCIDSPVKHGFTFTPAMSLYVACDTAAEVDRLFGRLSDGGQALMPLDSYPFNDRFAWVNDRFGVSWQLGVRS